MAAKTSWHRYRTTLRHSSPYVLVHRPRSSLSSCLFFDWRWPGFFVLPQHILQFRLYKLSPCSAGDHRVHSDTSLLWLHRADGLHLLARDRHDWILRCLLLHPQDLRGYQDWLSRQSGIIRRFAVSAGNLFPWLCDTARLVEWLAPCVSSGLTGWPFLENLVLLGNLVAVRETSRNWPNVRENSLSEKNCPLLTVS